MVKEAFKNTYDRSYKLLLIIPAAMLIFSIVYLSVFYVNTGDFFKKDVSLTGGTTITVFDSKSDINVIKATLSKDFQDIEIRGISDIGTGSQRGFILDTKESVDKIQPALEGVLGYKLTQSNSTIEFAGASLSQGFYFQLLSAIVAAFLLMAWVVFIIFCPSWKIKGIATMLTGFGLSLALTEVSMVKTISVLAIISGFVISVWGKRFVKRDVIGLGVGGIVLISILYAYPSMILLVPVAILLIFIYITSSIPSFAVILSAFADIVMTVAVVDIMGMNISSAGIIAFLMLIGYSVDTDILLTSRLLKSKDGGSLDRRLFGAFKTGMTMTLTAIAAVGISLFIIYGLSETLRQIFTIVLIGLFFDIFNTWFTNASMLKWYMEVKKIE